MSDSNNKTWVDIFMDLVAEDLLVFKEACDRCRKNEADIWTPDERKYCVYCWQEVTSPY